tara:strand:+ start:8851 stop:9036 length:186 start_codon:yes stop_codon:yes gene_type:complete
MQFYCGIDLHSNNSVISLIDKKDKVIKENRLANDFDLIEKYLAPFQDNIEGIVVESTYNWY